MGTSVMRENERYRLLDVIGEGGMGTVYRAIDKSIGRDVAIKMLKKGLADENSPLARFQREVETTAKFSHPNIVTVYALDEFDGSPCMVMEYLEGQSISQIIKSHRAVPLVEKIGFVCQVCDGLQYAHERGVIHRDMKPANVLVHKDVAKIVDFGIARDNSDQTLTRTGQAIGSLYYMSPEQLGGIPIDARTDIYSTGVMLYEFLTGEVPYKAPSGDPNATALKILNDPVPSLGKYLANYPPVLDEILQKAMAKTADARYQTIEDLSNDLAALEESLKRGMIQEFLAQARLAIERRDWERARQLLQEVRTFDRQNPEANELRKFVTQEIDKQQKSARIENLKSQAQVALAGLRYEEALECIAQALILDPGNQELLAISQSIKVRVERVRQLSDILSRAQAYFYAGDLFNAELEVRKAIEIDGRSTEARALEDSIRKELEERERRVRLQAFLDDAREKISSHDYRGALDSLDKAIEIDPADSNIRELHNWAARGHEQEQLRKELEKFTSDIGQLLNKGLSAEALSVCATALLRFPQEASLLKLQTIAKRHGEVVARRQAVERVSIEARRLADADRIDDALKLLEQELKNFSGDVNLEMLLSIIHAESDRKRQEREERARQQSLIEEEKLGAIALGSRQEALDLLRAFQGALSAKTPIPQLRLMSERASVAAEAGLLDDTARQQFSIASAEFNLRAAQWSHDCAELDRLYGSVREVKGSAAVNSLLNRARNISEKYTKDEDTRGRYQRIRQFTEELRVTREAVVTQVSGLVRAVQAQRDLPILLTMQKQVEEASAPWLEEPSIRTLVDESAAHIQEIQQNQKNLLQELAQLSETLSTARSAGQIRLIEEQAYMLAADSEDVEVRKAVSDLQGIARKRMQRLERALFRLKDLLAKASAAPTLTEAENHCALAQKLVAGEPEAEETGDLLRKIQHAVADREKEYRRISSSLESLATNSAQASGLAELDLILARKRDLLKKYPQELHFRGLETRLEAAVSDRRACLSVFAASELDTKDGDQVQDLDATIISGGGEGTQGVPSPAQRTITSLPAPRNRRFVLRFAVPVVVLLSVVSTGLFLARLRVITIPTTLAEADVKVDGQPCGDPCKLRLRLGSHDLVATRHGYEDFRGTITVSLLGTSIPSGAMVELATPVPPPIPPNPPEEVQTPAMPVPTALTDAAITVRTSVPDALVFLDDSAKPLGGTGKSRSYQFEASVGPHRIRVEKPGFEKVPARTVTVAKSREALVSFDLKPVTDQQPIDQGATRKAIDQITPEQKVVAPPSPPPPSVPLAATPPPVPAESFIVVEAPAQAEIHIDQQLRGHSTGGPFKSKVEPGVRTVEVVLPGFQPFSRSVTVVSGATQDVVAALTPSPAPATSSTTPADSDTAAVLRQYRQAYEAKDLLQLRRIWPTLTDKQFKNLQGPLKEADSIRITLKPNGSPQIDGARAQIACVQETEIKAQGQTHKLLYAATFFLRRLPDSWVIDRIEFTPIH